MKHRLPMYVLRKDNGELAFTLALGPAALALFATRDAAAELARGRFKGAAIIAVTVEYETGPRGEGNDVT